MSILKNFVADAIEGICGALSRGQNALPNRATDTDGHRNFAPVTAHGSSTDGDATGDATLALRSSNEEPRSGGGGLLPGTAHPGLGTYRAASDPDAVPTAEVFIDTDDVRGILGDVDWDVLTGGDAAVRILGDDGQLHPPGGRPNQAGH